MKKTFVEKSSNGPVIPTGTSTGCWTDPETPLTLPDSGGHWRKLSREKTSTKVRMGPPRCQRRAEGYVLSGEGLGSIPSWGWTQDMQIPSLSMETKTHKWDQGWVDPGRGQARCPYTLTAAGGHSLSGHWRLFWSKSWPCQRMWVGFFVENTIFCVP